MPVERLRISTRSALVAVGMFGATLVVLRMVAASQRVLGWMLAAAALAGLLHPTVVLLSRRMPRGVAVAAVMAASVVATGIVAYGVADALVREARSLQRVVPARAAELEREGRFADVARDLRLAERAERAVEDIPERLRGGTATEALRSAATRGVAFLATAVFTLFLLLHGARLAEGALDQVHDPHRRQRVHDVVVAAYRRGFGYARGTIAMAGVAGLLAYALALAADVPGPAPLAVTVALLDAIPFLGAFLGALPIIVLGGAASTTNAVLLTLAFLTYQLFEGLVLQRRVERATVRVGPFLTIAAVFGGLELYGIGGALIGLLATGIVVAALGELVDDDAGIAPAATTATATATPEKRQPPARRAVKSARSSSSKSRGGGPPST